MNAQSPTQYAIVDIETTGGYAAGSGITEIAILIHDGHSVTERYETLINPERPIPLGIQALTGINNEMVAGAPVFREVAAHICALLTGRVFVAHNVNFDYSFIRHHLETAGYPFAATRLCTVRLSRKIRPGLPSYSLGRLCHSLDIPLENHHRAGGDAAATAILFSHLLQWDDAGHIPAMLKKTSQEQALPPNLPRQDFDALPHVPGVYYFRDKAGKVVYIGKARDIKKRVSSHFTGHNPNPQRQEFLRHIHSIRYEHCGTELMAFLLEAVEIKRLWPRFNRAMKRFEPRFGLYVYEDRNGYLRIAAGRHSNYRMAVRLFHRPDEAVVLLRQLMRDFGLHPALCVFNQRPAGTIAEDPGEENSKDTRLIPAASYNLLVREALAHLDRDLPTFALLDEGRAENERSCIWVEKGEFYGMGYIHRYTNIEAPAEIKSMLTPYPGNHYMVQLILTYARKYPHKVVQITYPEVMTEI